MNSNKQKKIVFAEALRKIKITALRQINKIRAKKPPFANKSTNITARIAPTTVPTNRRQNLYKIGVLEVADNANTEMAAQKGLLI